ncbi:TcpQ domain-containing protein [Pseudomonas fragariae (ex Marin et al. 2024)]|uniref:TcpQ domain-containing protein n=1 Tax=Pseudomonas fragariae (ex Marin et al. 2024) TaxID=3080056 RepID=UPI003F795070
MNSKLASGGLLCAALLSGCSSSAQLTLPTGKWEELNVRSQPRQGRVVAQVATAIDTAPVISQPAATTGKTPVSPVVTKTPQAAVTAATTTPLPDTPKASEPSTKAVAPASIAVVEKLPLKAPEKPTTAPAKSFASAPVAPVVTVIAPEAKPIKPPPVPKPVWDAQAGETLRSVITRWSQKADYHADWQPQGLDYPIEAPLRFEGTFEESVISLFKLYDAAERPFCVDGRRGQRRLNISENLNPATQCPRPSP